MTWQVHPHVGDDHRVHIGSKICLKHLATGKHVRSSNASYPSGSGQQVVYAPANQPEHEDWWQVLGPEHQGNIGDVIRYGNEVRIHHMATSKWLHSHSIKSSSSGQNEVSAYGTEQQSDENDIWIVEKADGGSNNDEWNANDVFLLKHKSSGAYLHSHNIQTEIGGLVGNEVTTFDGQREDENNQFGTRFG
jgi:dolichyl-phosphate-mannose--protein O-mannosyl transferase